MMNKERVLALADFIEQGATQAEPEIGFNMLYFSIPTGPHDRDYAERPCGTVACIAGHAKALGRLSGGFQDAADWLGLDFNTQAVELFFPGDLSGIEIGSWSDITPAHGAAVLRRLAETGTVDWTTVLPAGMWRVG